MPTYRTRNGKTQAIVRVKREGAVIHQESRTFASLKLARQWGEKLEAQLKLEGVPARVATQTTLGELLIKHLEHLEKHTLVRANRSAEFVQLAGDPDLGKVKLSELTARVFSEFAIRRRAEGAGPTTVLHNLATVRSTLNSAKPLFGLSVDSASVAEAISALRRTGTVAPSQRRDRRPSDEEMQALLAEFDRIAKHPSTVIPMRQILELAVALPRRLGELTEMRWEDYCRKRKLLTLRDTKHPDKIVYRRDEVIPVPAAAGRIIESLPVLDERILPYQSDSVRAAFERARDRLRILDLHFHDLRHHGISRLFEQGLSIQEVAMISGHTSWAMLRRYTHLSAEALAEKMHAGVAKAPQVDPEPARAGAGNNRDPERESVRVQGPHAGGGAAPARRSARAAQPRVRSARTD